MKDKLLALIEQADREGMINFLRELTPAERKSLVPTIKKVEDYYNIWENRNRVKERVNNIAKFVCYPSNEVQRIQRWNMPELEDIDLILPWYCPHNFSDYQFERSYKYMIKWQQAGYLTLTPELVLSVLPGAVFKQGEKSHHKLYSLELIEEYPITLDEHIWYLFQAPSNVDWADKWSVENIEKKDTKGNWCDTFIKYTSEGRLDRMKVLSESLLTANRSFNKTQTGWFVDLFMAMEPTTEELLKLQSELFGTLTCVCSKPVSNTMKLLKKLVSDPRFRVEELLPTLPMLLSSEVKAIVLATLTVIEVILKKGTDLQTELCTALCAAFLSKDEAIQKKAATLFIKYISPGMDAQSMLSAYTDNLLMSTRTLLKDYLTETEESPLIEEEIPTEEYIRIGEHNKIPELTSVEDFAFFLSQALDLPEPYYFDYLLNNLIVWGNEITQEQLVLLEPAFQKAYKMLLKWQTPAFDEMPQIILTDYGRYLQKKFPAQLPLLNKLQEKLATMDKERSSQSKYYTNRQVTMKKLSVSDYNTGFHQIAIETIKKVTSQDTLPLLSTPTHTPTWIDPLILIERIAGYQKQGKEPIDMDMQLALQRCVLDNPQVALEQVKLRLTGEFHSLLIFLLDKTVRPQGPFHHPSWWMTAAITRMSEQTYPEFDKFDYNQIPSECISGNHKWDVSMQSYLAYGNYNAKTGSYDRYPSEKVQIRLLTPSADAQLENNRLFYRYLWKDFSSSVLEHILLAMPNNPDYMIGLAALRFAECDMWEVEEQTIALHLARILYELKLPFREMHYFALANFLLAKAKTVQDYGLAIWSDGVSADSIDAARLGKALGKIEALDSFPLKRLTDLMTRGMIGISHRHNQSLVILIESLLAELRAPIKNQKKLLEVYAELLAVTQSKPNISATPHWEQWASEGSLKKAIKDIMK